MMFRFPFDRKKMCEVFCIAVASRMGTRIEMLCGAFRYDYIMPPVRQKA